MHPIERLRHVARAGAVEHEVLVRETAAALAGLGDDPAQLLLSCRRLVDRHPTSGPLWTLCARVLNAGDPVAEAWRAAEEVVDDASSRHLASALPDDATVLLVGWPELVAEALPSRGDVEVLVVDALGEGARLSRRLVAADVDATAVDELGVGSAAAVSDLVVLEASVLGPTALVATAGSLAAAAVAAHAGVPVWAVAGVGRVLGGRTWDAVVARLVSERPWECDDELVPLDLVDLVVGPTGTLPPDQAASRPSPQALELLA